MKPTYMREAHAHGNLPLCYVQQKPSENKAREKNNCGKANQSRGINTILKSSNVRSQNASHPILPKIRHHAAKSPQATLKSYQSSRLQYDTFTTWQWYLLAKKLLFISAFESLRQEKRSSELCFRKIRLGIAPSVLYSGKWRQHTKTYMRSHL